MGLLLTFLKKRGEPMAKKELGTLQREPLRSVWPNEARDFTPWLAENLDWLGEVLEMDLELIEMERAVGSFSADILAKDISRNDSLVVIENQLEPTNHDHLGKMLTYAAGLDAKIVVWVSREVRTEHRQAVDWVNENSLHDFSFFAVEIELLRINGSAPAPNLKLVAGPNEWARSQRKNMPTERERLYHWYFSTVLERIKSDHPGVTNASKALYQSWFNFPAGRSECTYGLAFRRGPRLASELYIDSGGRELNKEFFDFLFERRDAIEKALDLPAEEEVSWERMDDRQASRIAVYLDLEDHTKEAFQPAIEWGIARLLRFREAFAEHVSSF